MANVSDWSANEKDNLFLDELNLSDQHGRRTAKIMAAVKAKEDEQDAKLDAVAGGLVFRGTKATYDELEAVEDPAVGDMYSVTGLGGENYAWNGEAWDALGTSDANVVHKTGNESIDGSKTFSKDVCIEKEQPVILLKELGVEKGTRPATEIRNGFFWTDKTGNAETGLLGRVMFLTVGEGVSAERSELRFSAYSNYSQSNNKAEIVLICGVGDTSLEVPRLVPHSDNSQDIGTPGKRWKEIYCANATINTSDDKEKTEINNIADDVLDAWEKIDYVSFKFKNAVETKGDNARLHSGVIAQRIKAVFESYGLDAFRYALLCRDVDEGIETWGVRYSEALCVEAACQRRMIARLKSRIEELEGRLDGINKQ